MVNGACVCRGEGLTSSLRMGCSYLYLPNCSSGLGLNGGLSVTKTEPWAFMGRCCRSFIQSETRG